jgi:hypothetical protein
MKLYNQHLDTLANGQTKILAFDCEFWRVYGSKGFIGIPDTDEFFIPRELGGFFLTKNADGTWEYKDYFFVTFTNPKGYDVSFVSSQFAAVSEKNAEELNQHQSLLQLDWSRSFLHTLPEGEQHKLLVSGIKIYNEDPNIKENHKPPSWIKRFLKAYSESTIIVKGTADIDALKNMCKIHGYEYSNPKGMVDIALWNKRSRQLCGTAKLEGTFDCISRHIDDTGSKRKRLRDILPLSRAHDPTTDASMTLLVAIYIVATQKK